VDQSISLMCKLTKATLVFYSLSIVYIWIQRNGLITGLNISTYSAIPSKCSVDIGVHQPKLRCMTYHYDIDRGHSASSSASATSLSQICKSNLHFISECVCSSTRSGTQQVACHMSDKEIGLS